LDATDWHRLGLDRIVGTPVAFDAKRQHVPSVETQPRTINRERS